MIKKSLIEWLDWVKYNHTQEINLSLERVHEMAKRFNLLKPTCPVITVAGTNGKGSNVAGLEAIYLASGYRVGAFTSPYLFRYNEQVRLDGIPVEDNLLCDAFERIVEKCDDIRLTQFELGTLAALLIFHEANLDLWILEVGLGGRYDAVNVIDADVAIITSIALDHMDWLGNTRELIALEKAGILRKHHPAVCGDFNPPVTLMEYANQNEVPLYCQNKQFGFKENKNSWDFWSEKNDLKNLPLPLLALQNMSTVLMAVELLQEKRSVSREAIDKAFANVKLPGRIQVIPGDITQIFDVSHNPAAVGWLADYLQRNPVSGKTLAVFSMLADKDIYSTIEGIKNHIHHWYSAPLPIQRGASVDMLAENFSKAGIEKTTLFEDIAEAFEAACKDAKAGDCILVFGSFHTVAGCMKQ